MNRLLVFPFTSGWSSNGRVFYQFGWFSKQFLEICDDFWESRDSRNLWFSKLMFSQLFLCVFFRRYFQKNHQNFSSRFRTLLIVLLQKTHLGVMYLLWMWLMCFRQTRSKSLKIQQLQTLQSPESDIDLVGKHIEPPAGHNHYNPSQDRSTVKFSSSLVLLMW